MRKFVVSLVTALAGFLSWLGLSNPAMATPQVNVNTEVSAFNPEAIAEPVNLNQASSLWQLAGQDTQEFFAHLACNCAACAGAVKQVNEI